MCIYSLHTIGFYSYSINIKANALKSLYSWSYMYIDQYCKRDCSNRRVVCAVRGMNRVAYRWCVSIPYTLLVFTLTRWISRLTHWNLDILDCLRMQISIAKEIARIEELYVQLEVRTGSLPRGRFLIPPHPLDHIYPLFCDIFNSLVHNPDEWPLNM